MPLSPMLVLIAVLLGGVAAQQQPGRIPCGTNQAIQSICDAISSHSTSEFPLPVGSECVLDVNHAGFFCGFAGAKCISDSQCDFGLCSAVSGVCEGGLGESCLGIDGPDDSLCLGNLGCSRSGNPTCGGLSAECGASGLYSYDDLPNHSACSSGLCDPETLICSHSTLRYQSPQLTLTGNSRRPTWKTTPTENAFTCAPGETICPISSPRAASSGFEFACVQTASSTSHCGGCATSEEFIGAGFDRSGVDCSKLEGVESSGCVDSKCRVFSCIVGYEYRGRFNACARKKYW